MNPAASQAAFVPGWRFLNGPRLGSGLPPAAHVAAAIRRQENFFCVSIFSPRPKGADIPRGISNRGWLTGAETRAKLTSGPPVRSAIWPQSNTGTPIPRNRQLESGRLLAVPPLNFPSHFRHHGALSNIPRTKRIRLVMRDSAGRRRRNFGQGKSHRY